MRQCGTSALPVPCSNTLSGSLSNTAMPPVGIAARSPPIESSVLRSGSRCNENQVVDLISAAQGPKRSTLGLPLPRRLLPIGQCVLCGPTAQRTRPTTPTRNSEVGRRRDYRQPSSYKKAIPEKSPAERRAGGACLPPCLPPPACLLFRPRCAAAGHTESAARLHPHDCAQPGPISER